LGGEYGNPGGNDFSDYQGNDGRLAIAMVNTVDYSVWAQNNTWGTNPWNVVKDSTYNTDQTPPGFYDQPGTGNIYF
jgi:hypothetical protein